MAFEAAELPLKQTIIWSFALHDLFLLKKNFILREFVVESKKK